MLWHFYRSVYFYIHYTSYIFFSDWIGNFHKMYIQILYKLPKINLTVCFYLVFMADIIYAIQPTAKFFLSSTSFYSDPFTHYGFWVKWVSFLSQKTRFRPYIKKLIWPKTHDWEWDQKVSKCLYNFAANCIYINRIFANLQYYNVLLKL
jgi:hypothetical protein